MGEFLETTYDKFVFTVKRGCFYSRDDFWASVEGDTAVIGVSDFLQTLNAKRSEKWRNLSTEPPGLKK